MRQRRLTHIPMSEVPTLVQSQQHWNAWKNRVQGLYPELSGQWDSLLRRLHEFAEEVPSGQVRLPQAQPSESPTRRILRLSKALLEQLDKLEADQCESVTTVLQELKGKISQLGLSDAPALSQQIRHLRRNLPTRRKCLDRSCPEAQSLIQELSSLAQEQQREGRWPECAEVWKEGVKICPEWLEARLQYGSSLHVLGRREEALQQFGQLPRQDARRHFHSALAWWAEGRLDECVQSIVLGMTYGREITHALAARKRGGQWPRADDPYWHDWGHLWTDEAQAFLLAVSQHVMVRWPLRRAADRGSKVRELLPQNTRALLIEKVTLRKRAP